MRSECGEPGAGMSSIKDLFRQLMMASHQDKSPHQQLFVPLIDRLTEVRGVKRTITHFFPQWQQTSRIQSM